jgi:hypothetical protein
VCSRIQRKKGRKKESSTKGTMIKSKYREREREREREDPVCVCVENLRPI